MEGIIFIVGSARVPVAGSSGAAACAAARDVGRGWCLQRKPYLLVFAINGKDRFRSGIRVGMTVITAGDTCRPAGCCRSFDVD
jgi:hypothetical protein